MIASDSNLKEIGDRLLQRQAEQLEAGSRLRWEPQGNKIQIHRRGSKKNGSTYVTTISKGHALYPEWEPVLLEYKRRRIANGGKRQKLDELRTV